MGLKQNNLVKRNPQFVEKVTFEPLIDFKQNNYEVGNITNAATFKSFLHLSYEGTWLLSLWIVLLNIFMRPTLTIDFWGLHKNVNWALPLMSWKT